MFCMPNSILYFNQNVAIFLAEILAKCIFEGYTRFVWCPGCSVVLIVSPSMVFKTQIYDSFCVFVRNFCSMRPIVKYIKSVLLNNELDGSLFLYDELVPCSVFPIQGVVISCPCCSSFVEAVVFVVCVNHLVVKWSKVKWKLTTVKVTKATSST